MAPLSRVFGGILAAAAFLSKPLLVQSLPTTELSSLLDPIIPQDANITNIAARDGSGPQPFYAIAHRVLMANGVRDALNHGANAIEIDMYAWKSGWYADHDGTQTSAGDTAEKMFNTVAEERKAGKNIIFVWLDLKNPDYNPDPNANTSIEGLRKLARDILQPAGVKVLYGFYGSQVTERSYRVIRDGLNENESIGVDGAPFAVGGEFTLNGPRDIKKRVMSAGLYNPMFYFGDCNDTCTSTSICPRLRCAAESKVMGKVFGWTISPNRAEQATKMMGEAHVDGLIYGFVATHYYDHADTRAALGIITDWLAKNKDKRYLATVNDQPW